MLPDEPVDGSFQSLLERARTSPSGIWGVLEVDGRPSMVALVVPVYADRRYIGALLLNVLPRDLLLNGLSVDTRERYRILLLADGVVLGATSASDPPAGSPTYAAALSPLPPNITLQASPFRMQSRWGGRALAWLVAGLAAAVGIALTALLRYTTQLVRADRVLVAETSLRRAMEDSLATGCVCSIRKAWCAT
jgi:hypothetical protein